MGKLKIKTAVYNFINEKYRKCSFKFMHVNTTHVYMHSLYLKIRSITEILLKNMIFKKKVQLKFILQANLNFNGILNRCVVHANF